MSRKAPLCFFPQQASAPPVEWLVIPGLVDYPPIVAEMEVLAEAIAQGAARERVYLLEHPPLYTAGTSAKAEDLISARFPVFKTGRGGQYTYHGPGQRVAYVMLDLKRRHADVRAYVASLEAWLIDTLATFHVEGRTHPDRVGIWVSRPGDGAAEDKIAALGIRLRRWVSFHGIALNVSPDLSHFRGIVPCGIADSHLGVTSLSALGYVITMQDVDRALRVSFERRFGASVEIYS